MNEDEQNIYGTSGDVSDGQGEVQQSAPQATPAAPQFDPNQFAQQLGTTLAQQLGQQRQAPQQLSQEEINARLGVYNPQAELADQLLSDDPQERMAALNAIVNGLRNEMRTYVQHAHGVITNDFNQVVQPLLTQQQQANLNQLVNAVSTAYPTLKGKEGLVQQAFAQLKNQGFQPQNWQQTVTALAQRAEAIAKQVDPNFSVKPANTNNPAPRMASTGQAGTTQQPARQNGTPSWMAAYGVQQAS